MGYISNEKVYDVTSDNVEGDNSSNDDREIRNVWSYNNIMQQRSDLNENEVSFQMRNV